MRKAAAAVVVLDNCYYLYLRKYLVLPHNNHLQRQHSFLVVAVAEHCYSCLRRKGIHYIVDHQYCDYCIDRNSVAVADIAIEMVLLEWRMGWFGGEENEIGCQ